MTERSVQDLQQGGVLVDPTPQDITLTLENDWTLMQMQAYQAGNEVTVCGSFVDGTITTYSWHPLASGLPTPASAVATLGVAYQTGWLNPVPVGIMVTGDTLNVYCPSTAADAGIISVNVRYHV